MVVAQVKTPDTVTGQKPEKTFRLRGISASIFANQAEGEDGQYTYHKVSFAKAYKDGDDWKHTGSFSRNDLPVLKVVLQRAFEAMLDMKTDAITEEDGE